MSLHRTNLKIRIASVAVLAAAIAVPPAAAETESVVPPGNSAVNQYTESFPTSRGNKNVHNGDKGEKRTPAQVLGSRNANRLEQQGSDGSAVAELATETAPPGSDPVTQADSANATTPPSDSLARQQQSNADPQREARPGSPASSDQAGGSSGLGEVIGHATGTSSTSSGEIGLLLPLLIVGTALWALLYAVRHRRRQVS